MKLRGSSTSALLFAAVISNAGAVLGQSAVLETAREATYGDGSSNEELSVMQSADNPSEPAESQATLGPARPEDINLGSLIPTNALTNWGAAHNLRFFGWANGGYSWSSTGTGLLAVEPRMNRFGDAWLLDQAAFVPVRMLKEDSEGWSWGFRSEFHMGADAVLLHPINGFGPSDNQRFSTDFRQAYLAFHAPILTEGGVDFKLGRQS